MTTTNPRSWKHEAQFVPSTIEDVLALQQRLVDEAGASQAKANGAVMWLLLKAQGTDNAPAPTRSAYRKLFAQLQPTGGRGPRTRKRSAGAASLAMSPAELLRIAYDDHGSVIVTGRTVNGATPIISDSGKSTVVVPLRPIVHTAERAA